MLVGLPLVQSKTTIDPNIGLRSLVFAAFLGIYLLYFYIIRRDSIDWKYSRITRLIFVSNIAFIVWAGISAYHATNPMEAVFELGRYGCNFLLFLITFLVIQKDGINWKTLTNLVIISVIFHGILGLGQKFDKESFDYFRGMSGPFGTMTNKNLYGSFIVLIGTFTFLPFLNKKYGNRTLAFIGIIICSIVLYYSDTRAAWLSATFSVVIIVLITMIRLPESRRIILTSFGVISFTLLVVIGYSKLVSSDSYEERKARRITKTEQHTKNLNDKSMQNQKLPRKESRNSSVLERLMVWRESIGILKDYPMFGVGLGNWKIEIPRYSIESITRSNYGKIVRIRAHNIYIQILSETGILGFIFLYVPWLIIFILGVKIVSKDTNKDRIILVSVLLAIVFAFALDGMFSFPNERIAHAAIQWLSLGAILGFYVSFMGSENKKNSLKWVIVLPGIVICSWVVFISNEKVNFETHMNKAREHYIKKRYAQAIEQVELGKNKFVTMEINKDPIELIGALSAKQLKKYEDGLEYARTCIVYNPFSTRIMNTEGALLTELKHHKAAKISYQRALKYSPRHALSLENLALNHYLLAEYDSCLMTLEKGRNLLQESKLASRLMQEVKRKIRETENPIPATY